MHAPKIGGGVFQLPAARAASPTGVQMAGDFRGARGGKLAIGGQHQFFVGQMSVAIAHTSPFRGAGDARQTPRQRERDRTERHRQRPGDLAIAQALSAQRQAPPIALRQGPQNSRQA